MRFHILNVGHGFCAYLVADNGNVMLFDCGRQSEPDFWPSRFLNRIGVSIIQRFFVTNYDEDHIADLPNIRRLFRVEILHRNPTISTEQLRQLKRESGPISEAMENLLSMMSGYNGPETNPPDFPRVSWRVFYSHFGRDFSDTNNNSLVIFLKCGDLNVLMPGDLEESGWLYHLQFQEFREALGTVDVFVASHHGRENGYCGEVFGYCRPDVIIFSDSQIEYGTQEMSGHYAQHARGIQFNGETRQVLTTRNDGDFLWNNL